MERHARTIEVESVAEFDDLVSEGATSMRRWRFQSVDLTGRGDALRRLEARGSMFLGCVLEPAVEESLRARGALLFPRLPDLPFDPYRSTLYTPEELYAGIVEDYQVTPDALVYAWSTGHRDLADNLAEALHDHAIDDALEEFVEGRRLVGVMGGHAIMRGASEYVDAARLGSALARSGLTVVTGGGPGAMEAANLGAYLSGFDDEVLHQALDLLAAEPTYAPSVGPWARAALAVRERWPGGAESAGVPTWYYGHEPPNPMATRIAKYFKNAIREDILLQICAAGIAFLPGRAGTVQEIFQDACENYYADHSQVAPMVLVGVDYWTRVLPAWPLLQTLAQGRDMAPLVHLVDTVDEAADVLTAR